MVRGAEYAPLRLRPSVRQQWLFRILGLASLLGHFLAITQAREVSVGYGYGWGLPPNNFFYQDWADGEDPWYSGDILDFSNSPDFHSVIEFPSAAAFSICNVSSNAMGSEDSSRVKLLPSTSGGWHTVYLGSPVYGDCELGMKFQISVFTPYPSPYPPPTQTTSYSTSPSPPPPNIRNPQWSVFSRTSTGGTGPSPKKGSPPSSKKSKSKKSKKSKKKGSKKKKKGTKTVGVPLGVVVPIIAIMMCIAIWYVYRKKYRKQKLKTRDLDSDVLRPGQKMGMQTGTLFTYAELEKASFSPTSLIGHGSAGQVTKGVLEDGTLVAIKRARNVSQGGEDDPDHFLQQVSMVSNLSHRGLVRLLGYCMTPQDRFLVWENLPNGSLERHLSVDRPGELDWNTRLRIAVQVAEALERLHVHVTPPIYHGDVKSANILLDETFNAKVADVGFPSPKGTLGYADPAYPDGKPSEHSDVYSFGVVLLELVTSRKPFDPDLPAEQQSLAARAVPLIAGGRVQEIADPRVSTEQNKLAVIAVAKVAMACLEEAQAARPSMTQVRGMLEDASVLSLGGGHEQSAIHDSEMQTGPAGTVDTTREDQPML